MELSSEDASVLFVDEHGDEVDFATALENAVGWIMNEDLGPEEFGQPSLIDEIRAE